MLIEILDKHLQLPNTYYLIQDKNDNLKISVYKQDQDMDELIGSYILETTNIDDIYCVCKEILEDILEHL